MKNHYTYRITNIIKNKHYYGVRSCVCDPIDDLGVKYFSSSTDKKFILDQKNNPQNYKYKVLRIYETRELASRLEIDLHEKFNVDVNEAFYNKAKATSSGFSISTLESVEKGILTRIKNNSYVSAGVKIAQKLKGRAIYINETGINESINVKDANERGLIPVSKGRKHTKETKNLYSKQRLGNNYKLGVEESDSTRLKKSIMQTGQNNNNAKKYHILDNNKNIVFECVGNLKLICELNGLPFHLLRKTKETGCVIKFNNRVKTSKNFIGWSLREIK